MKQILVLAMALLVSTGLSAETQDWKLTVSQNLLTDLRQTMSFASGNTLERNPLWQGVYRRPEFPVLFVGYQCLAADWIDKQRQKDLLWVLWGISQIYLVANNRQQTGYGIPVLSFRF